MSSQLQAVQREVGQGGNVTGLTRPASIFELRTEFTDRFFSPGDYPDRRELTANSGGIRHFVVVVERRKGRVS
jgi:hypothetical protein